MEHFTHGPATPPFVQNRVELQWPRLQAILSSATPALHLPGDV
jgi:hypothetical protein